MAQDAMPLGLSPPKLGWVESKLKPPTQLKHHDQVI